MFGFREVVCFPRHVKILDFLFLCHSYFCLCCNSTLFICFLDHFVIFFSIIKRRDQAHLHPKLEVPRLTCPGRESNPRASTVGGKSRSNSLLKVIRNIYIWDRDTIFYFFLFLDAGPSSTRLLLLFFRWHRARTPLTWTAARAATSSCPATPWTASSPSWTTGSSTSWASAHQNC